MSDKVLHDKESDIAQSLKSEGNQRGLASMICKFVS